MGSRKLWLIALALWFGFYCLLAITNVRFEMQNLLMGILAGAVCVLALLDR